MANATDQSAVLQQLNDLLTQSPKGAPTTGKALAPVTETEENSTAQEAAASAQQALQLEQDALRQQAADQAAIAQVEEKLHQIQASTPRIPTTPIHQVMTGGHIEQLQHKETG